MAGTPAKGGLERRRADTRGVFKLQSLPEKGRHAVRRRALARQGFVAACGLVRPSVGTRG